jgi:hypothetical protein
MYDDIAPVLDPKLYPTMNAIANVYEAAKRFDADAEKINPMELWDLHHARRIDDSGFIKNLYAGKQDARATSEQKDPEFKREQDKKKADVIAVVKACGHLQSESCGCD